MINVGNDGDIADGKRHNGQAASRSALTICNIQSILPLPPLEQKASKTEPKSLFEKPPGPQFWGETE
ncbi:hypothetical protein BEST7613_1538 [Synechocystis sp. PCC 6803]|nr:hypothetical protein BEST7613_1538 [Synechocystis sp. PCC 6803] [Bacillus subtilis BEST7613]